MSWTFDAWTSAASLPYIGFTIHFIDNDWKKVDRMLAFRAFPYPHTAMQYRETIRTMSREWRLVGKLNAGVTDNEAATVAGHEDFARFDNPQSASWGYHPMRCAIHTLQLPIKRAFKELATQLIKARTVSSLVHTSPKFSQWVKKECDPLRLEMRSENIDAYKGSVKLQRDCETRWNSTLLMLKLLMRMRKPLQALEITISHPSRRTEVDVQKLEHGWISYLPNRIGLMLFGQSISLMIFKRLQTSWELQDILLCLARLVPLRALSSS